MLDLITGHEWNFYEEEDLQHTDNLLKELENLGMLPPKIVNPKFKHLSSWAHADYAAQQKAYCKHPDDSPYEVNEWESEDPEMFPDGAK
jgi:hypothetical protein